MDPQIRSALSTLKAGTEEALQMLDLLHKTIHNNDIPEMVNWPELLDKYDVLMRKLHGLQGTLERGFSHPGASGFIQFTSMRDIALVPGEPIPPGENTDIFNILSRTLRDPLVREADEAAVARISERLGLANLADTVINLRMSNLIDEHDKKMSTAAFVVEELGAQYNWQRREEELDEQEETQPDVIPGHSMDSIGPSVSQRQPAEEDDSDDDMEMVAAPSFLSPSNPKPREAASHTHSRFAPLHSTSLIENVKRVALAYA